MDSIARSVNQLYERFPYPSLPIHSERDLVGKLHNNVMSNILATAGLGPGSLSGKDVLDAGCGTGEKSCYFSHHGARVTAIDLCSSSLMRGRELAEKFSLPVEFIRCDIADFRPEKKFDHIFCLGVLHHTGDPYMRFQVLSNLCKPGGTITVGLYSSFGRFKHRLRRLKMRLIAGKDIDRRMEYVEKAIFGRKLKSVHEQAFVADKYVNPYESYHSVGEVRGWFNRNGISCQGAYPEIGDGRIGIFLTQLRWMSERKGFFIVSGMKE